MPKVARAGPRISIAFRHGMVRSSYGKPDGTAPEPAEADSGSHSGEDPM